MATYPEAKAIVIKLLTGVTRPRIDIAANYGDGAKYNADSELLHDLGIPPERMFSIVRRFNSELHRIGVARRVTSDALAEQETIGDVITLFCEVAEIKIPAGEPQ